MVIKPADKGSAVVVLSKKDYINEAERQLNSHAHYTKLGADLTPQFVVEIKSFIHSMFANGQIDKHTRDFLIPHHSRVATLYLLPKIHKPGNLDSPIVSSNGAPTKNILRFMDWFLQPLQPLFRPTSGTLLTLLTSSGSYHYYPREPCW